MQTIKDIKEFIEYTKKCSESDRYRSVQSDLLGKDKKLGFTEYLISVSEYSRVDVLAGFRRQELTDFIATDAIKIMTNDNVLKSGIKIIHKPISSFYECDLWVGGYIEGFTCFSYNPEYFIWTYIKMDKLEDILSRFQNNLIDYRR